MFVPLPTQIKYNMDSNRQQKVNELIKRELSLILQQKARGWFGPELITITEVRISPDLFIANVYMSIFPSGNKEQIINTARDIHGQIRFELGNRLRNQLRSIPELRFFADDTLEQLERIDNLLKK